MKRQEIALQKHERSKCRNCKALEEASDLFLTDYTVYSIRTHLRQT